jgi:hypothetical protein
MKLWIVFNHFTIRINSMALWTCQRKFGWSDAVVDDRFVELNGFYLILFRELTTLSVSSWSHHGTSCISTRRFHDGCQPRSNDFIDVDALDQSPSLQVSSSSVKKFSDSHWVTGFSTISIAAAPDKPIPHPYTLFL